MFADSGRDPLCAEIPEWLQEFRENLVDYGVPEHKGSRASSSHEVSLEPTSTRSVDLGKHSVYTHFPEDRTCEICQRTKITKAPCRRRIGGGVPRAENFGDLITADHSQTGNLKSFTLTIPWNLAKPVKIFPGIIVRQHHTDQKQMGLLKEQCAE